MDPYETGEGKNPILQESPSTPSIENLAEVVDLTQDQTGKATPAYEVKEVVIFPNRLEYEKVNRVLATQRLQTLKPHLNSIPPSRWATNKELKDHTDAGLYPNQGFLLVKIVPRSSSTPTTVK